MSEQPADVALKARELQQGLKQLLATREPWDREVDFQRKNLRRRYLALLLVHSYTNESKDAETHLWMQTSYAFISTYRQLISTLDRVVFPSPRPQQQQPRQGGHGPVEYRKLLGRFCRFLAEEEKFWTKLVIRLRRTFVLDEAQPALIALGILSATTNNAAPANEPDVNADSNDVNGALLINDRNHFQFPPEDDGLSMAPTTPAEREGRLGILSKALICLGDIARYRELYKEGGGRPRAGHEDSVPARRGGRGRRGGVPFGLDAIPKARNYDKASQCYEQARLLVPYDGNPSHQLAILASYQKDVFTSIVHYYRALCVRQPYDTAAENLGIVLMKALDQWKARARRDRDTNRDPSGSPLPPRVRIEIFKEMTVILHALWRSNIENMDSISPNHAQRVSDDFAELVSGRHLPIDMISKAIVLSQGALWKHRMVRDPGQNKKSNLSMPPAASTAVESRILLNLLSLHRALLDTGLKELAEPPPRDAAEYDLAQRITATFRRTLPALRIASKWLRANFRYVMQAQESKDTTSVAVRNFWGFYARFSVALARAFPEDKMPTLKTLLEEDIEMKGFLPLGKMMGEMVTTSGSETTADMLAIQEQVHPNVEQLMRITDLLGDAKALTEIENSPIALYGNRVVVKGIEAAVQRVVVEGSSSTQALQAPPPNMLTSTRDNRSALVDDRDDDAMTETTDPVGDAFREALGVDGQGGSERDVENDYGDDDGDGDEMDDKIIYDPRISPPPLLPSSPARRSPITSFQSGLSPIGSPFRSSTQLKGNAPSYAALKPPTVSGTTTTAQDLLNNVMGLPRPDPSTLVLARQESSLAQPPLLWNFPGHSIWSTSLDRQSLQLPATGQVPVMHSHQLSGLPQDASQALWSSSISYPGQNLPNYQADLNHPASFASQAMIPGNHQRTPSAYTANALPLPFRSLHTQYGFSPTEMQQPIHRPGVHSPALDMYGESLISPNQGLPYSHDRVQNFHSRHFSLDNNPRVEQAFAPPPLSHTWGNVG